MLVVACAQTVAHARVLLISDVDDTIRVTHVKVKAKAFWRGAFYNEAFTGMAPLYHLVKSMPEGARIDYVSNKPRKLENIPGTVTHEKFLAVFPDGENLLVRAALNDNPEEKRAHKHAAIQRLLAEALTDLPPGERLAVALVGDNGEDDPRVYDEAVRLARAKLTDGFRNRVRFHQFIRNVYGTDGQALRDGQHPFTTAGELALLLARDGVFTTEQKAEVASFVEGLPADFSNYAAYAPKWINCSNHPKNSLHTLATDASLADVAAKTELRVISLCFPQGAIQ